MVLQSLLLQETTITPTPHDAGNSRATTLTYTVTGITNPTDLAGFTLVRRGAESLRDKSGNLPAADVGTRLDNNSAAIAARDTTPPQITVTVDGTSPKAMPSADGTAYTMNFRVSYNEPVGIDTTGRYQLASVDTSDPATITNLNIESAQVTAPSSPGNPFIFNYEVFNITDPTNIKAFTLVRSGDLLKDYSGNTAVRHDDVEIAVGDVIDDRDNALADRDTTPPQITVEGMVEEMAATADENGVYTVRFTVNATEPVKDLNRESSYELLNISFDDSVGFSDIEASNFTQVTANERYTVEFTSNNFASLRRSLIRNNKGFTLGS